MNKLYIYIYIPFRPSDDSTAQEITRSVHKYAYRIRQGVRSHGVSRRCDMYRVLAVWWCLLYIYYRDYFGYARETQRNGNRASIYGGEEFGKHCPDPSALSKRQKETKIHTNLHISNLYFEGRILDIGT